jgi:hypothetical protein
MGSCLDVCPERGIPFVLRWHEDARMGTELSKSQQEFEESRIQFIMT